VTIEAVVFDWGGVLMGSTSTMFAELEARLGVPAGSMPELLGVHPFATDTENLWHRRELGLATAREWAEWYAARVVAAGGIAIPPDLLVAGEREQFVTEPNTPVIDAVRRLKERGLRTAICTNNFAELGDAWRSMLPLELFDVVAVSCELGVRKPDAAMFEHVTAALGTTPESTVLLDDFEGNVEGARAAGWRTILVSADHAAAIAELDDLLAS
jgi:putative hydrolase of the HAD superfamily